MKKWKMERIEEMKDWIKEEKEGLVKERIEKIKEKGAGEDFYKALEQLSAGREGGSLTIAYLRTSYLTKSHKVYMGYYEGEPFVEEEVPNMYYSFLPIFEEAKEDWAVLKKKLEKKYSRILSSEEEEIRRWYMEKLYIDMGQALEEFLKRREKEGKIPVFYGGYMEELIQIGNI